jgi:hypothetical protein
MGNDAHGAPGRHRSLRSARSVARNKTETPTEETPSTVLSPVVGECDLDIRYRAVGGWAEFYVDFRRGYLFHYSCYRAGMGVENCEVRRPCPVIGWLVEKLASLVSGGGLCGYSIGVRGASMLR